MDVILHFERRARSTFEIDICTYFAVYTLGSTRCKYSVTSVQR